MTYLLLIVALVVVYGLFAYARSSVAAAKLRERIVAHLTSVGQATVPQLQTGLGMDGLREKGLIIAALHTLSAAKQVEVLSSVPQTGVHIFNPSMISYRLRK
ncbi:MAG: hypothetical protein AAF645_05445 [Myxococcota bacterium]